MTTVRPTPPPEPPTSAWFLAPADIAAINADDHLLDALAAGEVPDPSDPLGARLVAWLREVVDVPEETR